MTATKTKTTSTTYKMLSGEELDLPPLTGEVARFVARARAALEDPTVSDVQLTDLVYGLENPLLDRELMPGRAVVTKAVFTDPVWHMLCDLIGRKRAAVGNLDLARAEARYTMTVPEAAGAAGVHESAVRQAIAAKRLTAWKRGARWFLDPEEVGRYRPGPQGPAPPLHVRMGSEPGVSFRIKRQGGDLVPGARQGAALEATITNWERIAVIAGTKERARFFLLEPGETAEAIEFDGFFVRGRFRVVEKINHERKARDAFAAFKAEGRKIDVLR
jgi:hypothetical protein